MNKKTLLNATFLILAVIIPFGIFAYTRSDSLSFADAGEFAIVTKIASVAHGPGVPAYVMLGWIWSALVSLFTGSHLTSIMLFSVASESVACGLLYYTSYLLLRRNYPDQGTISHQVIALCTAFAFAFGFTAWYWANNVEVYAFQAFTFALMVYGLVEFNHSRTTKNAVIAAVGMALGLANHHLTTIFFLPFMLIFFGKYIFPIRQTDKQAAKKKKMISKDGGVSFFSFLRSRQFKIFAIVSAVLLVFFYGWMMMRASVDLPFKFGEPDNLSRLFFHISGGSWIGSMTERKEGIAGLRFPYFVWLTQRQFGFFLVFMIFGFMELFRKKYFLFAVAVLGYFLVMQFYQLGLDQIYDSDGYMLSSYYLLSFAIPFGAIWLMEKRKELILILPVLVIIQTIRNFPLDDKREHNVSKSLMQSLDESAPKNSVILAADWTLSAQYYYYRIVENFRPDLTFLYYDVKFTNYKVLPVLYPEFYKQIKPEYDDFVEKLGAVHPEQIYNTGDSFDTDAILNAYKSLIYKIKAVCTAKHTAMLMDPQAFVFLNKQNIIPSNYYGSGCFISETKTNIKSNFEKLPFKWVDLPLLKHEAGASDKLVDLQAMLDLNSRYFNAIGDSVRYHDAMQSLDHIKGLEKELKSNLPFIYRAKYP